jgi:hypothetical protein
MVGNEESDRYKFCNHTGLYCVEECWSLQPPRACFHERGNQPLESEPRSNDADAKDQTTAEADAEAGLHDPERGGQVPMARAENAASGAVLPDWLVHGQSPKRYYWFKMADGES